MVVEGAGKSHIQDLVGKSAASSPTVTIGHHRQHPLPCTCPVDKGQRLEYNTLGIIQSHSRVIADWGCNLVLGTDYENSRTTDPIRVVA